MYRRLTKWGTLVAVLTAVALVFPNSSLAAGAQRSGAGPARPHQGADERLPTYVPGEVLVKYRSDAGPMAMASVLSQFNLRTKRVIGRNRDIELLSIEDGTSVESMVAALRRSGLVEYASPNYIRYPQAQPPNDPRFGELWGLSNRSSPGIDVGALAAWDVTQGDASVVVGVTDTGIDIEHPDLERQLWTNPGETPNDGIDNDRNGKVDDVHGWDFYWDTSVLYDPYHDRDEQHGTHVAGTIAAEAGNAEGIAGVAPGVKIMVLKVCGNGAPFGYDRILCTDDAAIAAIDYAIEHGVRVINASWGGGQYNQLLYDKIKEFGESGGIFVAAAGNGGSDEVGDNNDLTPFYPASYNLPNIISVAAVDSAGDLASFSNYGRTSVDLGAPGVDILSTLPRIPGGPAAVTVSGGTNGYRAVVWGFGAEFLSPGAVQDAVYRAMDFLGVAPGSNVLLVDDDESDSGRWWAEDVRDTYVSAFVYNNYTVTVHPVAADADGPDAVTMAVYDAVVWFTGEAFGDGETVNTLTTADEANLKAYLDRGGKLFLSGEDILYNNENSTLVREYLHINWGGEWAPPDPPTPVRKHRGVGGLPGTPYEGAQYTGTQWIGGNYYDFLDSSGPADVVMEYLGDPDYSNAYDFWQGTSMATPHVAGVAALLLSHKPSARVSDVVNAILYNTTPLRSLSGKTVSGQELRNSSCCAAPQ